MYFYEDILNLVQRHDDQEVHTYLAASTLSKKVSSSNFHEICVPYWNEN